MRNKSKVSPKTEFRFERFVQISESHCGPAVLQMLLGNLGVVVSQEDLAEAGGVTDLIEMNGMRIDQMAEAVSKIAPGVVFWYKEQATLNDLGEVVNTHKLPTGIEWQGLIEDDEDDDEEDDEADELEDSDGEDDEDDSETGDDDYGHYSIVTYIDPEKKLLIIADPYKDYANQDRIFTFEEFDKRWYDYNEITNPKTGRTRTVKDNHVLFVITSRGTSFPAMLGMKKHPKIL